MEADDEREDEEKKEVKEVGETIWEEAGGVEVRWG